MARALESEAPYFVDYLNQELQERSKAAGAVDVYSTLDLHLQRIAQDAVRDGLTRVDEMLASGEPRPAGGADRDRSAHRRDSRAGRRPVLQPVAVQPRRQREAAARLGLQAVRLSRRVRARRGRRPHDITPATIVVDEPTEFSFNDQPGRRATTTTSTTARSRCAARSRTRAISRRSSSPSRPASTTSPRSGASSASARRRAIRRSRSASSRRRRSRSRPPTRYFRTAARPPAPRDRRASSGRQDLPLERPPPKTVARQGHDLSSSPT